jgi:hypothetical protein
MNSTSTQAVKAFAGNCAVSAVAIMAGFCDAGELMHGATAGKAMDAFKDGPGDGHGCAEIYSMLADWGVLAHEIWEAVSSAPEFDSAPGVFDYEVSEAFGTWFYRRSHELGELPEGDACALEMGALAWAFFHQEGHGPAKVGGEIGRRIASLTGFRDGWPEPDAPAADTVRYEYNLGGAWIPTTAEGYAAHKATGVQVRRFELVAE